MGRETKPEEESGLQGRENERRGEKKTGEKGGKCPGPARQTWSRTDRMKRRKNVDEETHINLLQELMGKA